MNRMIFLNDKLGFSLIEVMVAVMLLGIIVVPVSTFFITSINNNNEAYKKMDAYLIAVDYMESIKKQKFNINEDCVCIMGKTVPIHDGCIEMQDEDYRTYINITENELLLPQYDNIKSLKVRIKVTEAENGKGLVELSSDISVF